MGITSWRRSWVAFAALVACAQAQDIQVGEWEWLYPDNAPAKMPAFEKVTLKVPEQLKNSTDYAYAVQFIQADPKGRIERVTMGSTTPWIDAASIESGEKRKIISDRGQGPIYTTILRHTILNPASASASTTTRAPRLVKVMAPDVSLIFDDLKGQPPEEFDRVSNYFGKTITAQIKVDANGIVAESTFPDELPTALQRVAEDALDQWRFEPARVEGRSSETLINVPILFFLRDPDYITKQKVKLPKLIKDVRPLYPPFLNRAGLVGEVNVSYFVELDGHVSSIRILSSSHPAFSESVIEAMRQWRFEPAHVNGVARRLEVTQTIDMRFTNDSGQAVAEIKRNDQSGLPEDLRVDVPPQVTNLSPLIHPTPLLDVERTAKFKAAFVIGADGRPSGQMEFTEAKPEFILAAKAMIDAMRFIPASKDGKPHQSVLALNIVFDQNHETAPKNAERSILRRLKRSDPGLAKASELDAKPQPLVTVNPTFPSTLRREGVQSGSAKIECYVDHDGTVLLPHILEASHPEFGYAAVQAVSQWKFKPVTRKGKPVTIRIVLPFSFGEKPKAPAPPAS